MLLGGIWHGAGWTYAAWGGYHGSLLVVNHLWSQRSRPLPLIVARALTLAAVIVGWVMFRAKDLSIMGNRLKSMAGAVPHRAASVLAPDVLLWHAWSWGCCWSGQFAPNTKQWVERKPLNALRASSSAMLFFAAVARIASVSFITPPAAAIYLLSVLKRFSRGACLLKRVCLRTVWFARNGEQARPLNSGPRRHVKTAPGGGR